MLWGINNPNQDVRIVILMLNFNDIDFLGNISNADTARPVCNGL